MRKRVTMGTVAMAAMLAVSGTTPAQAIDPSGYHTADDRKPPKPCNPYPPGKPFNISAMPSQATVKKGGNIDVVAFVTRGNSGDKKPCVHHLTIMRFKSRPGSKVMTHRTSDRGTAAYVAQHIMGPLDYYFDLLYNNTYYSSNVGHIDVR